MQPENKPKGVILGMRLYCAINILWVVFFFVLAIPALLKKVSEAGGDAVEAIPILLFTGVSCLLLVSPWVWTLFMKRNAITWWCGLITLAMSGAFLCLPLPFGIVLLVMWLKPEVRAWFMPPKARPNEIAETFR